MDEGEGGEFRCRPPHALPEGSEGLRLVSTSAVPTHAIKAILDLLAKKIVRPLHFVFRAKAAHSRENVNNYQSSTGIAQLAPPLLIKHSPADPKTQARALNSKNNPSGISTTTGSSHGLCALLPRLCSDAWWRAGGGNRQAHFHARCERHSRKNILFLIQKGPFLAELRTRF
jgi:hypothetical protein